MSRLNRQADEMPWEKLKEIRRTMDELKVPQTFGGSNVRIYHLYRQGEHDIVIKNLTTTSQGIEVTLTPDVVVDSPVIAYDLEAFLTTTSAPGVEVYATISPQPPSGGVQKWQIWFATPSGTIPEMPVDLQFWAIAPGTYTVVKL